MDAMQEDSIQYDKWVEDALRGVVRRALAQVESDGLAGDHNFYITFLTNAEGVVMPRQMKAQHPQEMTIVIQHQYEDLKVSADSFEVALYFAGKRGHLHIPLSAITIFTDPSVNFALQFKFDEEVNANVQPEKILAETGAETGAEAKTANKTNTGDDQMGEVIALDKFRKK